MIPFNFFQNFRRKISSLPHFADVKTNSYSEQAIGQGHGVSKRLNLNPTNLTPESQLLTSMIF